MKKIYTKFLITIMILCMFWCINFYTNANDVDWLAISHKLTTWEVEHSNRRIRTLSLQPWKFWKSYHDAHEDLNFWERLATGVLEIDDLLYYMVFVVQFLSQLGLLVWVCFIMYAWYKYMLSVFNWWKTGSSTLKNAIIWVIIVIFSYAIMKILTSIIWLT